MPTVILVAAPGRLRDSLRVVLMSVSGVTQVRTADSGAAMRQAVRECNTALVLIDATLAADNLPGWLGWLKLHAPTCEGAVLVENKAQVQGLEDWPVLWPGFSTEDLNALIQS